MLRNVGLLDSPTKWVNRALGVGYALAAHALHSRAFAAATNISYPPSHSPPGKNNRIHCVGTSKPVSASLCRIDGEGRPLLFPMATAQLFMKADKCGLRLDTQTFCMAPGLDQLCSFLCSLPPRHTLSQQCYPVKERWGSSYSPVDSSCGTPDWAVMTTIG